MAEKKQIDRFRQVAKELECDDDEERFKERLKKIVKPERSPSKPAKN